MDPPPYPPVTKIRWSSTATGGGIGTLEPDGVARQRSFPESGANALTVIGTG
ncbi:MAG: hypothetical protein R3F49_09520 [Planctomycetota bacterium]